MLTQYESTPKFGNASGSGEYGDDEMADDEDGGEDEEDEEDGDNNARDVWMHPRFVLYSMDYDIMIFGYLVTDDWVQSTSFTTDFGAHDSMMIDVPKFEAMIVAAVANALLTVAVVVVVMMYPKGFMFGSKGCPDNFKTRLAAFKLEGDALSWWKAHLHTQVGGDAFADTCTWVAFREIFYNRYFPTSEQQRYKRKYGSICQLDRENSGEYMERFTRLASFVGATAGDVRRGQVGFKRGLKKWVLGPYVNRSLRKLAQGHALGSASQRRSIKDFAPPPLVITCEGLSQAKQRRREAKYATDFVDLPPTTGRVFAKTRDQAAKTQKRLLKQHKKTHVAPSLKQKLSAVKARTLISHVCQGFLASVMDTSLENPNIENLSVVREFADVFPDELPGLPPAREIEFGI
ncbi:zinc finger, CCHC-type, retrotransposon gag domain protein [Tanacetum coccineum]